MWRQSDYYFSPHSHLSLQNEREMVNISKESWQNLLSRVLLLETKMELREAPVRPIQSIQEPLLCLQRPETWIRFLIQECSANIYFQ